MKALRSSFADQPNLKRLVAWCVFGCATFFMLTGTVQGQVTFTGSQAVSNLSASVTFSLLNSTDLVVTLTDTWAGDTADQSHILTGVFFSGATGLTPVSATAGIGSKLWQGTSSTSASGASVVTVTGNKGPSSVTLGTEWAYASGPGAAGGAASGIVSSGYNWAPDGGSGNFATPGDMLDGSSYGILSAGYAGSDLDGLGSNPYIQDSMVFTLSGFTGSLNGISDVVFQYGTHMGGTGGEPNLPGLPLLPVPEPSVMAELAIASAALVCWAGRRRNNTARAAK